MPTRERKPTSSYRGMDIRGKAALVTGGSRGLGAALGEALAKRGARVVLVARDEKRAREGRREDPRARAARRTRSRSTSATRRRRIASRARPRRWSGRSTCWSTTRARSGRCRCRSCSTPRARISRPCSQTNLVGPFRLDKIVAGSMALRAGVIVHVSSDAAVNGYPRWGAYGVSKAALDQLGRVLGAELARARRARLLGRPRRDGHADARRRDARRATIARRSRAPSDVAGAHRRDDRERRDDRTGARVSSRLASGRVDVADDRAARRSSPRRTRGPSRDNASSRRARCARATCARRRSAELPLLLSRWRRRRRQRRGDAAGVASSARRRAARPSSSVSSRSRMKRATCDAVVFGAGDWRTPTEHRAAPPPLAPGDTLVLVVRARGDGRRCRARRTARSHSLRAMRATTSRGALSRGTARAVCTHRASRSRSGTCRTSTRRSRGRPRCRRPGGPLDFATLDALRKARRHRSRASRTARASRRSATRRSTRRCRGSSATAFPRRPPRGRTAARSASSPSARPSCARSSGCTQRGSVTAHERTTNLRIDRSHELRVVEVLLTGMHDATTSHADLARRPSSRRAGDLMAEASRYALARGFLGHEFGDSCLIFDA